jgi:hypothetical protein
MLDSLALCLGFFLFFFSMPHLHMALVVGLEKISDTWKFMTIWLEDAASLRHLPLKFGRYNIRMSELSSMVCCAVLQGLRRQSSLQEQARYDLQPHLKAGPGELRLGKAGIGAKGSSQPNSHGSSRVDRASPAKWT